MASLRTIVLLSIILVLHSSSVTSFAIVSPFLGDVCKKAECGKGTCRETSNGPISYACDCEPGWKQAHPLQDDFKFMPCVIPNCTLNSSCGEAPSPSAPPKLRITDIFSLDFCQLADCGGGTCKHTSRFTYKCECNEGYFKLLNVSAFPCFKPCALEADCLKLGINTTNTSLPSLRPIHSQATSLAIGDLNWMVLILFSLALTLWR